MTRAGKIRIEYLNNRRANHLTIGTYAHVYIYMENIDIYECIYIYICEKYRYIYEYEYIYKAAPSIYVICFSIYIFMHMFEAKRKGTKISRARRDVYERICGATL